MSEMTQNCPPLESKKLEILYEGYLYDVTSFVPRHPGGNIIKFYTGPGEDATIAIQQFHQRSLGRVQNLLKGFSKRPVDQPRIVEDERRKEMTKDYQELYQDLKENGFFEPSYGHIALRMLECSLLLMIGLYLCTCHSIMIRILGSLIAGLAGGRAGWFQHEAGHNSLTGYPNVDRFLQSCFVGVFTGISAAWWRSQHNRHHAMPQRLKHDVDLETLPLIAFNHKVIRDPNRDANILVRNQTKLFVLFNGLVIFMFWRFYLCPRYALRKGAYLDLCFVAVHFYLSYSFASISLYLVASFFAGNYLLVNFTLSHSHLPVATEPKHWVEYCLSHTVDIEESWWCDWFMGYLNYQIEHHLFPTMPQFRQRLIKPKVKALAEKYNLPYVTMTYWDALQTTIGNLKNVENFARKQKSL